MYNNNRLQPRTLREISKQIVFETELKTKKDEANDDEQQDFDTMSFDSIDKDDDSIDSFTSSPSSPCSCDSEDSTASEAMLWKSVLNYYCGGTVNEKVHGVY